MRMNLRGFDGWYVNAAVYFHRRIHADVKEGGLYKFGVARAISLPRPAPPGKRVVGCDLVLNDDSAIAPFARGPT